MVFNRFKTCVNWYRECGYHAVINRIDTDRKSVAKHGRSPLVEDYLLFLEYLSTTHLHTAFIPLPLPLPLRASSRYSLFAVKSNFCPDSKSASSEFTMVRTRKRSYGEELSQSSSNIAYSDNPIRPEVSLALIIFVVVISLNLRPM
ncbi:hypothetical protein Hanom_Chr04g00330561 [Helianthus anomalus]